METFPSTRLSIATCQMPRLAHSLGRSSVKIGCCQKMLLLQRCPHRLIHDIIGYHQRLNHSCFATNHIGPETCVKTCAFHPQIIISTSLNTTKDPLPFTWPIYYNQDIYDTSSVKICCCQKMLLLQRYPRRLIHDIIGYHQRLNHSCFATNHIGPETCVKTCAFHPQIIISTSLNTTKDPLPFTWPIYYNQDIYDTSGYPAR